MACPVLLSGCLEGSGGNTGEARQGPDRPPHHGPDGRFRNLHVDGSRTPLELVRWLVGLGPPDEPIQGLGEVGEYEPVYAEPDRERIMRPDPGVIQLTWIGHATFLLQMGGISILTDPHFSERASPVSFAGPRRLARPGLSMAELPPIDVVLISHSHYDHLDRPTVRRLGQGPVYLVPLGLERWFREAGVSERQEGVRELDWWDAAEVAGVRFRAVPAQHFSARTPFDRNKSLWCGFVVEHAGRRVYFAGDTGYSPHFKELADRLGPVDLALLPIGAYSPRWFMRPMHVNPEEAVTAHQDLGARVSVAMHWGTFKLTDEPMAEPPVFLRKVLNDRGIGQDRFQVLGVGQTVVVGDF